MTRLHWLKKDLSGPPGPNPSITCVTIPSKAARIGVPSLKAKSAADLCQFDSK